MTHTPEELAMARSICAKLVEGDSDNPLRVSVANAYLAGDFDASIPVQSALLAIQATTEAAAALIERGTFLPSHASERHPIRAAKALRDRAHLKGNPHDSI